MSCPAENMIGRTSIVLIRASGTRAADSIAQHPIGFEPNRARVRAEIRASEDPRGPSRHVVTFESFEQRQFDLRLLSDRGQRDLLFLALEPELRSERFIHRTPTGKSIAHPTGPHT